MGIREVLVRTPSFSQLEPALVERLSAAATARTYSRDQCLWRAGDQPVSMVVVQSGLLKLSRPVARGRSALCGLFGPPESVGDLALVRGISYPASAIVATPSATIISIPRKEALAALQESRQFALQLACAAKDKVDRLHDKIDILSAGAVEARLATLLLKLYERFGDDFDDGSSRLPVALSRQDLADLVATSFETVIRLMTRWEREGTVSTDRGGFTLADMRRLRETAGQAAPDTFEGFAALGESSKAS